MIIGNIIFLASYVAPKPEEVEYWIDLTANPYGGVIKYYDGKDWIKLDQNSIAEDYNRLRNKPTLNGVTIEGDKTSEDYNIPTPEAVNEVLDEFRNEITVIDNKVTEIVDKVNQHDTDITEIKEDITDINNVLENLIGESASEVIDKFNEILAFLDGYTDDQTLKGILDDLEAKFNTLIEGVEDDIDLAKKELTAQINSVQDSLDNHVTDYNNPHKVTKVQVGLGNVDNTSDMNKPISTLVQQALDYEATVREETDDELFSRINNIDGEIDSIGNTFITEISDFSQTTDGVNLNYTRRTRQSIDDEFTDENITKKISNATSQSHGTMSSTDKSKIDRINTTNFNLLTPVVDTETIKIDYTKTDVNTGTGDTQTLTISTATSTTAGLMSAADKQALSNIGETYIPLSQKGQANGVATLDESGLVPASQLPSYVDDVIEVYADFDKNPDGTLTDIVLYYDAEHQQPVTGEAGKIYIDITVRTAIQTRMLSTEDTLSLLTDELSRFIIDEKSTEEEPVFGNYQFRWTGTTFAVINASTVIGEVTGTAYDGGKGKYLYDKVSVIDADIQTEGSFRKADADVLNTSKEYVDTQLENINTVISEDFYTKNESDDRYLKLTGGVLTGSLKLRTSNVAQLWLESSTDSVLGRIQLSGGNWSSILLYDNYDVRSGLVTESNGVGLITENREVCISSNSTVSSNMPTTGIIVTDRTLHSNTNGGVTLGTNNNKFRDLYLSSNAYIDGSVRPTQGVIIPDSSDDYVVLAGGGTKALSEITVGREFASIEILGSAKEGAEPEGYIDFSRNGDNSSNFLYRIMTSDAGLDFKAYSDGSSPDRTILRITSTKGLKIGTSLHTFGLTKNDNNSIESAGHALVFNGVGGYCHKSYYFLAGNGAQGITKSAVYIGNCSAVTGVVDINTDVRLTHQFLPEGNAIHTGSCKAVFFAMDPNDNSRGLVVNDQTILRGNVSGDTVLSCTDGRTIYLRPKGTTSSTNQFTISGSTVQMNGQINASSGFYEQSDIRLKNNITTITTTKDIQLIQFNWKESGKLSYGVIAQDVEKDYPELVSTDRDGFKNVNYDALLCVKVAQLENKIKQLKKELEGLKNGCNNI